MSMQLRHVLNKLRTGARGPSIQCYNGVLEITTQHSSSTPQPSSNLNLITEMNTEMEDTNEVNL